jgi:hypothetical protein
LILVFSANSDWLNPSSFLIFFILCI